MTITATAVYTIFGKVKVLLRPEKPIHATNENLLFFGWYKEPECANLWEFYRDVITENTTLYARWYSIETSGMDYPIAIVSCEGKQFKVLKEDLPGPYWWTKDGEQSNVHYNPCPEGWETPTINELYCIEEQLRTLVVSRGYWSREGGEQAWGKYFGKYVGVTSSGEIQSGSLEVDSRFAVRCVKYD